MNQSVTRLTLDVSVMEKQACISVRQKDTMRRLVFSLVDRGLPYKLEDGVYAAVSVNTLPETILYTTVIQDGKVHFDVPKDLVQEVTDYTCELILFAADSRVLSTSSFDLIVYHSNAADYNADEAVESDKFLLMTSATAEALDAAKDARNAEMSADAAAQRADEISETLENKLEAGEFKGEKGDTGATGPQGPQGIQGVKGDKGDTGDAVFFRYSAYENGLNFTDNWSAGQSYIGTYVGKEAPTDPGQYQWVKFTSNIRETVTVNLSADGWVDNAQTIEIHYIGTESAAFASPTPTSTTAYLENGVMLDSISDRSLTFTCVSVPDDDISVEVTITDPMVRNDQQGSIPDGEQPTEGKYVMRDTRGNLTAFTPEHPEYPNLIYRYEHTLNKEVHPTAVDLETGVWTAEGHGLTNNQAVYVVVNAPYHLNKPYQYLPGGLKIGSENGKGQFAKKYYATVVDENTFTLSESSGGAAVTFTEVSTMDLSKFHFELHALNDLTISNLPDSTELFFVLKGRMINGHRYIQINNYGVAGAVGLDNDTYVWVGGGNAALYLGTTGGWGSMYLTAEIKFIEEKHVLMSVTQDTMSFTPWNSSVAQHVRKYVHHYMEKDYFNTIKLHTDGTFANGTTVEVYSK